MIQSENFTNSIDALNNIFYAVSQILENQKEKNDSSRKQQKVIIDIAGSGSQVLQTVLESQSGTHLSEIASGLNILTDAVERIDKSSFTTENGSFSSFIDSIYHLTQIDVSNLDKLSSSAGNNLTLFFKSMSSAFAELDTIKLDGTEIGKIHTITRTLDYFLNGNALSKIPNPLKTWYRGKKLASYVKMLKTSVFDVLNGIKVNVNVRGIENVISTLAKPSMVIGIDFAATFLSVRKARKIADFYTELIKGFNVKDKSYNFKDAYKAINSVNDLIKEITKTVLLLTGTGIIAGMGLLSGSSLALTTIAGIGTMLMMFFGIMHLTVHEVNELKGSDKAISSMNGLMKKMMLSMTILTGMAAVISFMPLTRQISIYFQLGLLYAGMAILSVMIVNISKKASETKRGIKDIGEVMLMMSGSLLILAVAAEIVKHHEGDFLLMMGGMLAMIGGFYLMSKIINSTSGEIMKGMTAFAVFMGVLTGSLYLTLGAIALATVIMRMNGAGYGIAAVMAIVMSEILIYALITESFASETYGAKGFQSLVNFSFFLTVLLASTTLVLTLAMLGDDIIKNHKEGLVTVMAITGILTGVYFGITKFNEVYGASQLTKFKDLTVNQSVFNFLMFIGGLLAGAEAILLLSEQAENVKMSGLGKVGLIIGTLTGIYVLMDTMMKAAVPGKGTTDFIDIFKGRFPVQASIANFYLFVIGLTGATFAVIKLAEAAEEVSMSGLGKVSLITISLIGIFEGLKWLEKSVSKTTLMQMAVIEGLLGGLSIITWLAGKAAKAVAEVPWNALLKIPALLGELTLITVGFGALMTIVGAIAPEVILGVFVLEGMIGGLAVVIGMVAMATMEYEKAVSQHADINNTGKHIGQMLSGFVTGIASSFFSWKTLLLPVAGIMSASMLPLFKSLSMFISDIQQFADLKRPVAFDGKGNPVAWEQFTPEDFTEAAKNITSGFDFFIKGILQFASLENILASAAIHDLGKALVPIMTAVSSFTDSIMKLSEGTYTLTDSAGNKIIRKVLPADFTKAGMDIGYTFNEFIKALIPQTNQLNLRSVLFTGLFGKALMPVMKTFSFYAGMIMALASGVYQIRDSTGNMQTYHISVSDMNTAAKNITHYFSSFLITLLSDIKQLNWWRQMALHELSRSINPVMQSAGSFINLIMKGALGLFQYTGSDGKVHLAKVTEGEMNRAAADISKNFSVFLHTLVSDLSTLNPLKQMAMSSLADNIKPVMKGISEYVNALGMFAIQKSGHASLAVIKGYDSNGNPEFETRNGSILRTDIAALGNVIGKQFSLFVKNIANSLSSSDLADNAENTKDLLHDSINPIFEDFKKYAAVFSQYAGNDLYKKVPYMMFSFTKAVSSVLPVLNGDAYKAHLIPRFGTDDALSNVKNYMAAISAVVSKAGILSEFNNSGYNYSRIMNNINIYVAALHKLSTVTLSRVSAATASYISNIVNYYHKLNGMISYSAGKLKSASSSFNHSFRTIGNALDDMYKNHHAQIEYFIEKTSNIAKNLEAVNNNLKAIDSESNSKAELYQLADVFHQMTMDEITSLQNAVSQINMSTGIPSLGTNIQIPNTASQVAVSAPQQPVQIQAQPVSVSLSGPFVFKTARGGILMKGNLDGGVSDEE